MSGLRAAGYDTHAQYGGFPARPGDVLVTWNRYEQNERIADKFEREGGTVLVAENGYVKGRHDGGDYYALARHAHNGRGQWPQGGPERWRALGVELAPWRKDGEHVLVAPNRSFGMAGGVMPHSWADDVARRLGGVTRRPIRVRPHPGNFKGKTTLDQDLKNAWACVIWSSSCGVQALIQGVPVICEAPWWICKSAAASSWDELHQARSWDRVGALERLAFAQWTVAEIASGEPFRRLLLSDTRQSESAAAV